jgi:hypothetical protein
MRKLKNSVSFFPINRRMNVAASEKAEWNETREKRKKERTKKKICCINYECKLFMKLLLAV